MSGADGRLEDAAAGEPGPLQPVPHRAGQFREGVVRVRDGLAELFQFGRREERLEVGAGFLKARVTFADFLGAQVDDRREVGVPPPDIAREDGLFGVGGEPVLGGERL